MLCSFSASLFSFQGVIHTCLNSIYAHEKTRLILPYYSLKIYCPTYQVFTNERPFFINYTSRLHGYRINYHNYLMYTLQDIHQKKHTLSNFCLATHVLHNESTYYTLPIKFKSLQFADLFSLVCLHKRTTRIYLGGRVLTKLYNQVPSLYKQFWLCFNARIVVLSPIICLNF